MADDLGRRAHAIFKQMLDADTKERAKFVDVACEGNELLRTLVGSLVDALDETQGFLETPALKSTDHPPQPHASDIDIEIPGYDIESSIGMGGMATVYKATQQRPRRPVALKVMKRGLAGTSARRRFEFETEVLARLRHPGIAQIFEAGASNEDTGSSIPYFAMEYVTDARPLTTFADEQSLGLRERVTIFAMVCDAVQHGHQNGVIHRDLKPGNILVDADGQPKVIDFGIARSTEVDQELITQHTDIGQLIGTLNYMSPEQCTHSSAELDVRTDVYSLGVILYEMLCGRRPLELSRVALPEALRRIQNDTAIRPSATDSALRGDLEAIVLKALAKEPDRRYRSAAELGNDLRRHLRHETVEARSPTALYQLKLFAQRNRSLVGAIAVVMVILIVSTAVSVYLAHEAIVEARSRSIAEATAVRERDTARWQGYIATVGAAQGAHETGEFRRMRKRLDQAPAELRGWEWEFLSSLANPSVKTIDAHEDMITVMSADANTTRLATAAMDGSVRIWDAKTQSLIAQTTGHSVRVLALAVSPDGTFVVSGSLDQTVRICDAQTGRRRHTLEGHSGEILTVDVNSQNVIVSVAANELRMWDGATGEPLGELRDWPRELRGAAFSPDGERFCTWGESGELWIHEANSGEVVRRLNHGGAVHTVIFSGDKRFLISGGEDGVIRVWRIETGEQINSMHGSLSIVRALALTSDDQLLAAGQGDRSIYLWSVHGSNPPIILQGHAEIVAGLQFSLNDDVLYSASWDRSIRVWDMNEPEPNRTMRGPDGGVYGVTFNPDGSLIAVSSAVGSIELWDSILGTSLGTLQGHRGTVYSVTFSPDGLRLLSASQDQTVKIWNAVTGKEIATLRGHTGPVWRAAYSPEGQHIVSGSGDTTARIWDARSGALLETFSGHTERINSVAFSPDGTKVASASRDHSVRLWDVEAGKLIRTLHGHESDVFDVVFSADGKMLYSGSRDQTVRIWDVETGESLNRLGGHGQFITSLALSPDGSRLAAGSWFREILLWDLETGDTVATFKAHDNAIRAIAFDPAGRRLVSGSIDQTARVWDIASRKTRWNERDEAIAQQETAALIVADLFATTSDIELVAQAVEVDDRLDNGLRPWARKIVLRRSLAAESEPSSAQTP